MDHPPLRESLETMRVSREIHLPIPMGFDFSAPRIREVCTKPTDTHLITWEGLEIFIYAKASDDYVDVMGVGINEDPWRLMFALRAFSDLCERPLSELTPLQIVELMAERFGLTIFLGDESGKFFLEREIPTSSRTKLQIDKNQLFDVENLENHRWYLPNAVDHRGSTVRVAMAFCIDMDRYGEWVTQR